MTRRRGSTIADEGPSEDDLERFSGVTQNCPECGTELHDDAAVCWKCGRALMGGNTAARGWPTWAYVVVIAAVIVGTLWIVR